MYISNLGRMFLLFIFSLYSLHFLFLFFFPSSCILGAFRGLFVFSFLFFLFFLSAISLDLIFFFMGFFNYIFGRGNLLGQLRNPGWMENLFLYGAAGGYRARSDTYILTFILGIWGWSALADINGLFGRMEEEKRTLQLAELELFVFVARLWMGGDGTGLLDCGYYWRFICNTHMGGVNGMGWDGRKGV
ncbi:hypothetical protein DFH27DRAFT_262805 [Peziza echinospora]|nr:hypothetical protein DFH27DRAFT_262805 [Peziza echinospora]